MEKRESERRARENMHREIREKIEYEEKVRAEVKRQKILTG